MRVGSLTDAKEVDRRHARGLCAGGRREAHHAGWAWWVLGDNIRRECESAAALGLAGRGLRLST